MSIRTAIDSTLTNADIPAYWMIAPHDAVTPCVVYQQISTSPMRAHTGNVADRQRWQLSCWAHSADETELLATTVKGLLDLNQSEFEIATVEAELDFPDADRELFRKILEFQFWKKE